MAVALEDLTRLPAQSNAARLLRQGVGYRFLSLGITPDRQERLAQQYLPVFVLRWVLECLLGEGDASGVVSRQELLLCLPQLRAGRGQNVSCEDQRQAEQRHTTPAPDATIGCTGTAQIDGAL